MNEENVNEPKIVGGQGDDVSVTNGGPSPSTLSPSPWSGSGGRKRGSKSRKSRGKKSKKGGGKSTLKVGGSKRRTGKKGKKSRKSKRR